MDPNNTQTTVADRKSEFVPVAGGGETTSAEALLITAYVLMWLFVFVFVYRTWSRQQGLAARLVELEGALRTLDQAQAGTARTGRAASDSGDVSAD